MAEHAGGGGGSNQQRRSRHLWVGNVGAELSEEDIRRAFDPYGEILSIRLVRETSCCFVNFRNVEDAVVARQKLQRTVIPPGESKIEINFGKRQDNMTSRHLWVGNLESDMNEDNLKNLFAPFGQVLSVRLLRETNCGFVNFKTVEEAVAARTAMQGKRLSADAKPIEIDFKFPRNQDSNGGAGGAAAAGGGGGRRGEDGSGGGKSRSGGRSKKGGNGQQQQQQQGPAGQQQQGGPGQGVRYAVPGAMPAGIPDYDLVQPLPMVVPAAAPAWPRPAVDPPSSTWPRSSTSCPSPLSLPPLPCPAPPRRPRAHRPGAPAQMGGPPPMVLPQAWRPRRACPRRRLRALSPTAAAAVPAAGGALRRGAAAATAALAAAAAASSTTNAASAGGEHGAAGAAGGQELEMASSSTDWTVRVKAWRYWCQLFHRAESEDAQVMYAHADDCASQP
eukprot:tig00021493_g21845.t1